MSRIASKARWLRWLLLSVLLLGVVGGGVRSSAEPPPQQRAAVDRADQTARQKPVDRGAPEVTFWDWTARDPAGFYTFVLACLTAILAIVSFLQIYFLRRADRTARISADAARKSSDTADATLKHMAATAAIQLRAYLAVDEVQGWFREDPPRMTVKVTIKNVGATPAHEILARCGLWVAERTPTNLVEFPAPPPEFYRQRGTLAAAAEMDVGGVCSLPDPERIRKGDVVIFAHGDIGYSDVFGQRHTTTFRLRCTGERGLAKGRFDFYQEGNEAD